VGGSWSTRREPTHTRGEHKNSTQKGPRWGSNLEPSLLPVPHIIILLSWKEASGEEGTGVDFVVVWGSLGEYGSHSYVRGVNLHNELQTLVWVY